MIRNSSTQNRAALKSPTQLLRDRLGLSPKKKLEEKVRVFTAPAPMIGGCVLPGPSAAPGAMGTGIVGRDVRARTQAGGRAAWWCKFDRLVVFDGVDAEGKVCTRSSKGLSIARRRGDAETVVIALECGHCRDMLRREEWKYDVRVCKRGVCWDCRERCAWEAEQERVRNGASEDGRERADSVVQDAALGQEVDLCVKAGIEVVERGTIEVVGGIEERLDAVVEA
ncbi:hypothetical protein EJ04DRAFT_436516 [Polyplosphaeria fusca]|uniref:Uncharacterized protein n=1 Tax=Polyplosphaeria fusca TaxID=682080 RepID=A0A9P4V3W0_9PLEO|nr:hypothetical protein EJ04DRAFT_436516 [Polyplosphaeria fusca]